MKKQFVVVAALASMLPSCVGIYGSKGNDTGGIIPWSPETEAMALHTCWPLTRRRSTAESRLRMSGGSRVGNVLVFAGNVPGSKLSTKPAGAGCEIGRAHV